MEEEEGLYPIERELISIIRNFDFLRIHYGYSLNEISYGSRENPSLVYMNYVNKMRVHIIGRESGYSVQIQRRKIIAFKREDWVFDISDYYKYFDCGLIKGRNYTLKTQADFIQKHLMPVIKGEMWIDDLIKKKTNK
ncbi:MAG: hypothetical protein PHO12_08025 [Bacteroidales bacterium]|nr:hypothetical protein [Bacteroidales bacterium]MDD4684742.1 hypothetical protein [Bacteroidales bacterium]